MKAFVGKNGQSKRFKTTIVTTDMAQTKLKQ